MSESQTGPHPMQTKTQEYAAQNKRLRLAQLIDENDDLRANLQALVESYNEQAAELADVKQKLAAAEIRAELATAPASDGAGAQAP